MLGLRVREGIQCSEAPTQRGAKESTWDSVWSILVLATNLLEKVAAGVFWMQSLAVVNLAFVGPKVKPDESGLRNS